MSWIDGAFDEFGRSIGLSGLRPGAGGRLSLHIGAERRLDLRVLEDAVLVMLVRPLVGERLPAMRRALDACHLRHGWALAVRAGLSREGQLVFIARLPLASFRPDILEQSLDLLGRLHDRVHA